MFLIQRKVKLRNESATNNVFHIQWVTERPTKTVIYFPETWEC